MDVFIEFMVKRKKTVMDYLIMIGSTILTAVLVFILFFGIMPMIPSLGFFVFLFIVGLVYFAYIFVVSFNSEYEYALVNDEIDVDRIFDQKRRKRLTTVNIRGLEAFGRCCESHEFDGFMRDSSIKKIRACTDKKDKDTYYALYLENDKRTMILFNPNEKMLERIKKLNPYKASEFGI